MKLGIITVTFFYICFSKPLQNVTDSFPWSALHVSGYMLVIALLLQYRCMVITTPFMYDSDTQQNT